MRFVRLSNPTDEDAIAIAPEHVVAVWALDPDAFNGAEVCAIRLVEGTIIRVRGAFDEVLAKLDVVS